MTYPAAMTSMRRWVPLVAAVAVVLAACGSSGDGDGSRADTGGGDRVRAVEAAPATTTSAASTTTPADGVCDFRPAPPAAREVHAPAPEPADEGLVTVELRTADGPIPMLLDRALAPCNVENLVSLADQSYFDDTECHRLTTQGIFVLQCGDPTATGTGGPGYTVPDEFPEDLPALEGPDGPVRGSTVYPRGSIAIANTGARNSGGSQFFLVYADSPLPPQYSLVGVMSEEGLATVDAIAARGVAAQPADPIGADGAPAEPVVITEAVVAAA